MAGLIKRIAEVEIPRNTGDFRLMSRRVVEHVVALSETHGFLRGLVALVGFKQTGVAYDRDPRTDGASKYNRWTGSLRIGMNGIVDLHLGMGLARLQLEPPSGTDRLPRAVGEPVDIVRPEGVWHVHNANWSPDGQRVAFVHDADRSTIFELPADAVR